MKKYFNSTYQILAVFIAASVLLSCEDTFTEPEGVTGTPISQLADQNADLDILTAALTKTNLVSSFNNNNSGQFTVFAPTDAAFIAYFQARLANAALVEQDVLNYITNDMNASTSTVTISALAGILSYHVISSKIPSSDITTAMGFTTLSTARLSISKTDLGVLLNANGTSVTNAGNGAKVVVADVEASNGIVHVIDRVLVPVSTASALGNTIGVTISYSSVPPAVSPTLSAAKTAADANSADFDVLVYAIVKSGLTSTLTPNKSPLPDFTYFTPTDAAFYTYLSSLTSTSITTDAAAIAALEATPATTIAEILKAHVVAGRVLSSDLSNGLTVNTLASGKNLTVSISGASVILKTTGPDATVTSANVLTNAGVVHRINQVLKP